MASGSLRCLPRGIQGGKAEAEVALGLEAKGAAAARRARARGCGSAICRGLQCAECARRLPVTPHSRWEQQQPARASQPEESGVQCPCLVGHCPGVGLRRRHIAGRVPAHHRQLPGAGQHPVEGLRAAAAVGLAQLHLQAMTGQGASCGNAQAWEGSTCEPPLQLQGAAGVSLPAACPSWLCLKRRGAERGRCHCSRQEGSGAVSKEGLPSRMAPHKQSRACCAASTTQCHARPPCRQRACEVDAGEVAAAELEDGNGVGGGGARGGLGEGHCSRRRGQPGGQH